MGPMSARAILARSPALLAVALWFASTLYFLGNTGKHSDDYWVAMRSMVTGGLDWAHHPWVRWPYFWRPLHLGHVSAMNTLSWDRPWVGHLELALVHGGVAWMLCRLLTRLGVRRGIAWVVAVLFMVCPLNGEAALWTSASCNAIASLFVLRTMELVRRQGAGSGTWVRDVWIGLLAFITACWYEPAAASLAAVPLVYLAGRPREGRVRWWGVLRSTVAAGLGCSLYEGLLVWSAPTYVRGGAASFVAPEKGFGRVALVGRDVLDATVGERAMSVIAGSVEQGWSVVMNSAAGILMVVVLLALAVLACAAMLARAKKDELPFDAARTAGARMGMLFLAGTAVFACAWIPIIAIDGQRVELRSLYVPLLGVGMMGAAIAERVAMLCAVRTARTRLVAGAATLAIVLGAATVGAIGMIGFQAQFRGNAAIDRHTVEELARLLPNPPAGTIFLPLRIDARGARTGHARYDHAIHGAFETPYCCGAIVQWVFRRTDISGAPTPWWMRTLTAQGFSGLGGAPPTPWEACVPFVVSADGEVRLVRRMTIDAGDGAAVAVEFPRVPEGSADRGPAVRLREIEHAHCEAEVGP